MPAVPTSGRRRGPLYRWARPEPVAAVIGGVVDRDPGDPRRKGPVPARLDHRRDRVVRADDKRLDAAVARGCAPSRAAEPGAVSIAQAR